MKKENFIPKKRIVEVQNENLTLDAAFYAMKNLTGNAFKLWFYIAHNGQSGALNSLDLLEKTNMSRPTYLNSFNELIEKNFLQQSTKNLNKYSLCAPQEKFADLSKIDNAYPFDTESLSGEILRRAWDDAAFETKERIKEILQTKDVDWIAQAFLTKGGDLGWRKGFEDIDKNGGLLFLNKDFIEKIDEKYEIFKKRYRS